MARSIRKPDWSEFVARPQYLAAIETAIAQLGRHNRNGLVFYGQSDLTWQLSKGLEKRLTAPCLRIFLNGSGLKQHATSPLEGVRVLRNQLVAGGVDCSCFDTALLKYLLSTHTHVVVEPVRAARLQNRADAFSALADLIGAGQDLEVAQLLKQLNIETISPVARKFLPEIMAGVMGMIEQAVPPAVFLAKLGVFLVEPNEQLRQWIREQRYQDLQDLKQISDPYEIPDLLPRFLARDLKRHLSRADLPTQQQRVVVFIGDYNALIDDPKTGQCRWLAQMMSQAEASPYVLWVITAEQPLAWMTEATQIPVVPLEDAIADAALRSSGIQAQSTRQVILEKAQGSPLYLNTCVDICREMKRLPQPQDFADTLAAALRQQIDTWEAHERFTLQLLSVPMQWDQALFEPLMRKFHPALASESDEDQDRWAALLASAYVEASEAGTWRLHPLVKQPLYTSLSASQRAAIHSWLYDYYQDLYPQTALAIATLDNILEHGLHVPNATEAIDWVLAEVSQQRETCAQPELGAILSKLIESGQAAPEQLAIAWQEKGQLLSQLFDWENALAALETARAHWSDLGQAESLEMATVLYALSQVYLTLERTYDAHQACYTSSRLLRQLLGEQSPQLADVLNQHAKVKAAQGDHKEAITLSDQALAIATAQADSAPLKIAEFKLTAAQLRCTPYTLHEAVQLCQDSLAILKRTDNSEHFLTIQTLGLLGNIYYEMGQKRWQNALQCFQQAYEIAETQLGSSDPWTLEYLRAQIRICQKAGLKEQAQTLAEQLNSAVELDSCTDTLETAKTLNRLGLAKQNKGEYGRAEAPLRQALRIHKIFLGNAHPDVATSLNNLAVLYEKQGRYGEAEPLFQHALALRKRLLGDAHPDVATSLNNLAALYGKQGRYSEAEPLYQQALALRKRLLGDAHPDVATSLNNLALLYDKQGRYSEAEPLFQQALALRKRLLGDAHPHVATSLNNLAALYDKQGRYSEAEPLYQQALALSKRLLGDAHPHVATSLNNLAALYDKQGRYSEAEPLYQQALALLKRLLGDAHPHVATSLNNLAALYDKQGRYSEAEPLYQQALALLKRLLGDAHPDVATSLNNLASLYDNQGRYSEAEPLYQQALALSKRLLGENHPLTQTVQGNLERLQNRRDSAEEPNPS
ncbi:MAG: tetratricopeptide repeat protein [Leptolyngbya sp. SIO4C1]|nr:tetratricopeptide repeat protein [Leptolyngbya sp. SIO4C1]